MKGKIIEEMARDLIENLRLCAGVKLLDHQVETIAYELSKKYQPKLPENAVVLTREEYETYTFIKRKWGNQDAIKWSELVDGLYEFAREFSKETAEKFAERLKAEAYADDGMYYLTDSEIDEICKEITGVSK